MTASLPTPSLPVLRLATSADYTTICAIADRALGADYFTPAQTGTLIVAEQDGAIVGFSYGITLPLADVRVRVLKGRATPEFGVPEDTLVGVLQTIAVSTSCQRQGIGQLLAESLIRSLGAPPVLLSPAWRQPGGEVNAARVLSRVGMTTLADYPEFWTAESRQLGYACPSCGNPCRCEMVLFGAGLNTLVIGQP
jgi:hypothetical protein